MSDRNRGKYYSIGLGAALVLSTVVGLALWQDASTQEARYEIEAQDRAADYADATRIEAQNACIAAEATPLAECIEEGQGRARPEQREEYDLEAQRTMAVWTRAMGLAAIIGMAVGIFGVGLIFVTFRETRRAADEARRAADQAEQSRRSYIERERGHLKFNYPDANARDDELAIWLKFTNIGVSLAEIDGISADIFDGCVWPSSLSEPSSGMQVKVAAGTQETICFRCSIPVKFPCYFLGFITYKSLGEKGYRSYFAITINEPSDNPYGGHNTRAEIVRNMWMPDDT